MNDGKFILVFFALIFVSGCSVGFKEGVRGFAGVSTKALEDNLGSASVKEFGLDYPAVYSKTNKILKDIGAYIYARDDARKLIAIYVSEQDTTPVGIFFKEAGPSKTSVQVSSPSRYARELIAGQLFPGLEK